MMEGLDRFERNLDRLTDGNVILAHLAERHGGQVVQAIVGSTKAGVGPGAQPYAPYSPRYAKRFAGAAKLWLFGVHGNEHMLDPARFSWGKPALESIDLLWSGATPRMAIYGPVHQGTDYGGRSHTKGQVPPRPWMHFDAPATRAAVGAALEATMHELAASWNSGADL